MIEGFHCRESVSKVPIADLTKLEIAQFRDDNGSWRWRIQRSLLYSCEPSTTCPGEVEVGGELLECQRHRSPGLRGSGMQRRGEGRDSGVLSGLVSCRGRWWSSERDMREGGEEALRCRCSSRGDEDEAGRGVRTT
jgi:hypothetical protein